MFRYTTPYHRFRLPFDPAQLYSVYITYAMSGTTILEKTLSDVRIDDNCLVVHLTQEETALFTCGCEARAIASVQLRGKFLNGEVWAAKRLSVSIDGVYKEEVI